MKIALVLVLISLLFSCAHYVSNNTEDSPTPIPQPTLSDFIKTKKAEWIKKSNREIRESIKKDSKSFGLSALADNNPAKEDLEIRIWRFAAFSERNVVLALRRINGSWSANLIEKTIAEKDLSKKNPPIKFSRKSLGKPKSGWEKLWKEITDAEILTLFSDNEAEYIPCLDCWLFVIETNTNEHYRIYGYNAPEVNNDSHESQQIMKIINIISDEFNLNVFNQENFLQP